MRTPSVISCSNRALRTRRRELDDPKAVIEAEVRVEPPPEPTVKRFGTLDI
jgi:hypothetical protein